ncbi:MAG: MerR family DNA-binding transcriptional regulator [Rhizobium sp.]|uniref:MerR family transcriptional regulator n=1 Tax=Rhizobium sp. TaxID=391 RepID=UPI0030F2BD41
MVHTAHFFSPSEAAARLGISIKALRIYEQRGLVARCAHLPAGAHTGRMRWHALARLWHFAHSASASRRLRRF